MSCTTIQSRESSMLERDRNNTGYIQKKEIEIGIEAIKQEPDDCGQVNEELYANHEIKEDIVIGPEMIQPAVLSPQFLDPLEQVFVDKKNLRIDVSKSKLEEYLAGELDSNYDDDDSCTSSEESDGKEYNNVPTSSQVQPTSIWSPNPYPDRPIFPFLLNNPGKLTIPVQPYDRTPLTYFQLILTDEILDIIVEETNQNAVTFMGPLLTTSTYQWDPITREELLVFFGLLIHMGTVKMPEIQDYWSSIDSHDGLLYLECFSKIMSKNRFKIILNYLSFCRHKQSSKRLHKIRNLVEYFNRRMNEVYTANKELCVEEPVVIQSKHKSKIKLYTLLESSGLIVNIHPEYVVKETQNTQNVVKKLVQNLKYLGYSIYMTKTYNSISLAQDLLKSKIYCTGILRPNMMGNPKEVTKARLAQGRMIQRFTPEGICVSKWRNKRDVLMLSTEWSGDIREYQKPENIYKYTQYMNTDKLLAHNCESWSLKWDKRLAIYIIEMIVANSWRFFYNENINLNQKEYRLELTKQLIRHDYPNRPIFVQIPPPRKIGHFPRATSPKPKNPSRRKLLRCRQCGLSKVIKKTTYYCSGCPLKTGLCVDCFGPYHTVTLELQF